MVVVTENRTLETRSSCITSAILPVRTLASVVVLIKKNGGILETTGAKAIMLTCNQRQFSCNFCDKLPNSCDSLIIKDLYGHDLVEYIVIY